MQSMLPEIYPTLSENYKHTLFQAGIIVAIYQLIGSVLQPLVGGGADKKLSYSLPTASFITMIEYLMLR